MKYVMVCNNPECKNYNLELHPNNYRMKYDRIKDAMFPEFIGAIPLCSKCSQEMEFRAVHSLIPAFSVSTFRGLSEDKKKEILRKRYEDGFAREGGYEKESNKRKNLEKLIGYGN